MKFTVPAQIIRAAQSCQARSDVRYYLNGVCFHADGSIYGTNGHILFKGSPVPYGHDGVYFTDDNDVPVTKIISIDGKIPASAQELTVDTETMIASTEKGKVFKCTEIDGSYPDCDRIIPKSDPTEISTGASFNPKYLSAIAQVFPDTVDFHYAGHLSAVTLTLNDFEGWDYLMVIMPVRNREWAVKK